ncbi:MAG TPA: hypothetical protein VFW35_11645 [Sphingomicrobium sp.]|nr:hypothetical protein [Sphingomicrobium sp.]
MRTPNWTTLALIGALILLILLIAYFVSSRNPDQDKLTGNEVAQGGQQQQQQPTKAAAPEKLCASPQTYDLIKRELFRRAAQLRGSDQTAFDQLSTYAVVRMENPVMESQNSSTQAVNCSGSLSLDLPPGVAVVGGRRTLSSDVDYTIQPAADGSGNVVLLRNADAIIAPLATLARVGQTAPAPAAPAPAPSPAPGTQPAPAQTPTVIPPQPKAAQPAPSPPVQRRPPPATPVVPTGARPSFDCAKARTKGEIAVCSNAGLAALDRNMAAQYGRAVAGATPEQRALLRATRGRFLAYRDRCPNRACIGDAYVGRMREIRDIMEGTWQPRR